MELKRVFECNICSFSRISVTEHVCSFHSVHFKGFSSIDAGKQDGQRNGSSVSQTQETFYEPQRQMENI